MTVASPRPLEPPAREAPPAQAPRPLAPPGPRSPVRLALLWRNAVGKKALMAVTGMILAAYVLAHLLGNLQIYAGGEKIDAYAAFLHASPGLLGVARVVLLAAVGIHAGAGLLLTLEKRRARPIPYTTPVHIQASLPSRTMIWSGLAILAFVAFHVAHLTLGAAVPGYEELRPSVNVPAALHVTWAAAVYLAAMVALGAHLWHGLHSMFQSLGFGNPRYAPVLRTAAAVGATLVALGDISIPVAVLAGLLR